MTLVTGEVSLTKGEGMLVTKAGSSFRRGAKGEGMGVTAKHRGRWTAEDGYRDNGLPRCVPRGGTILAGRNRSVGWEKWVGHSGLNSALLLAVLPLCFCA